MNEHLRRAIDALEAGTTDVRALSRSASGELRSRIRATVEEVLTHLEAEENEPEDVVGRLDRQSKAIAEDLRRAERLMRQRSEG
ncbi:MAG: hypothetical protein NVSMB52_14420 [Chloroflexota bacterium]